MPIPFVMFGPAHQVAIVLAFVVPIVLAALASARHAIAEGWLDDDRAAAIEGEAVAAVEAAIDFGRESPFPAPELVAELVYAT